MMPDESETAALISATAAALRSAGGNPAAVRAAIADYLRTGYAAGLTGGELTDFFCVDTPSILDDARYDEPSASTAVAIFDELNAGYRRSQKR